MKIPSASFFFCAAVLLSNTAAAQQHKAVDGGPQSVPTVALQDREWFAYRGYYQTFVRFRDKEQPARYPFLRIRLRVWPSRPNLPMDGLVLQLVSASVDQLLPVDPIAGVDLPLSGLAAEEDGLLRLNRAKGSYTVSVQYSVQVRPDGVYAMEWLKSACEQGFSVRKTFGLSYFLASVTKSCVGITFYFPESAPQASVVLRDAGAVDRPLPMERVPYFGHGSLPHVGVVRYKFRDGPQDGKLVTRVQPQVIDFILE